MGDPSHWSPSQRDCHTEEICPTGDGPDVAEVQRVFPTPFISTLGWATNFTWERRSHSHRRNRYCPCYNWWNESAKYLSYRSPDSDFVSLHALRVDPLAPSPPRGWGFVHSCESPRPSPECPQGRPFLSRGPAQPVRHSHPVSFLCPHRVCVHCGDVSGPPGPGRGSWEQVLKTPGLVWGCTGVSSRQQPSRRQNDTPKPTLPSPFSLSSIVVTRHGDVVRPTRGRGPPDEGNGRTGVTRTPDYTPFDTHRPRPSRDLDPVVEGVKTSARKGCHSYLASVCTDPSSGEARLQIRLYRFRAGTGYPDLRNPPWSVVRIDLRVGFPVTTPHRLHGVWRAGGSRTGRP